MSDKPPPRILSIAGSDSGGGAGIQADIKTITMLGGYAMTAITAITAQNSRGVQGITPLGGDFVVEQIDSCLTDFGADAIKIGMLHDAGIIAEVAKGLATLPEAQGVPLILDPVMVATSGARLLREDAVEIMRERLFPVSTIATPNLPEARILAELPNGSADECAEKLLPFIRHLLITGGHGDETEVHNRLYCRDGSRYDFSCQRLPGSYHGSGCTLASALSGRLALGEDLASAVKSALDYTWRTLRDAEAPGHGQYIPRRLPLDLA